LYRVIVERVLNNEDKPVDILARWGPYCNQVNFYLRKSKSVHSSGMCTILLLFTA